MKSNITEKNSEQDTLQKIRSQLDHVQRLSGEVEQRVADARGILRSYSRNHEISRYDSLNEIILEAAKNSEYLTDKLRRLTLELTLEPKKYMDYKTDLVLIHGIKIAYEKEILSVRLPVLVPHRKSKYTDYLYKPLYMALKHWCMERSEMQEEIPVFCRATVCFIHCYDRKLPLARVRDNDNIEEKHVLDAVGNFFLKSDNGIYVNTYHETKMDEEDRTYLYLMPNELFPEWISHKNTLLCHIEK